jgi:hypothetical protein
MRTAAHDRGFSQRARWIAAIVLVLACASASVRPAAPAYAQADEQAAALTIVYPGVEILRAGTAVWRGLRVGALSPVGPGDRIRTGRYGRAFLDYGERDRALLLPNTEYDFIAYDDAGVRARLNGRLVFDGTRVQVRFTAADEAVTVEAADGQFAIQSQPSPIAIDGVAGADTIVTHVVTACGRANAQIGGTRIALSGGDGLRVAGEQVDTVRLPLPFSFAAIDAALFGCPATVAARGELNLNVRIGPSFDYTAVGDVENGTPIALLAVSPNGERYRIQYLSSFGWVLATGVQTACTDLPVLPYSTVEFAAGIARVTEAEIPLLEPFFGPPEDDLWFYR